MVLNGVRASKHVLPVLLTLLSSGCLINNNDERMDIKTTIFKKNGSYQVVIGSELAEGKNLIVQVDSFGEIMSIDFLKDSVVVKNFWVYKGEFIFSKKHRKVDFWVNWSWYVNGRLKQDEYFMDNERKIHRKFYEDGSIKCIGYYKKNLKDSSWIWFSPDGEKSTKFYKDGKLQP